MAFTADEIEDGTGKTTSIVYGTADPLAEALTFLARQAGKTALSQITGNVGAATPDDTFPLQDSFLIQGTRYVETLSFLRVKGRPRNLGQALLQPRFGQRLDGDLINSDVVPSVWIQACAEAAELAASGEPLFSSIESKRGVSRQKTGAALDTSWFEGQRTELRTYYAVERLLERILEEIGQLERA